MMKLSAFQRDAFAVLFLGIGLIGCSDSPEQIKTSGADLVSVQAQISHPQFKAEKAISRIEYLDYINQEFKNRGQSEFDPSLSKDDSLKYKKTYSNGAQFFGNKTVVEVSSQKLTTIAQGKLTTPKQKQLDLWLIVESNRKNGIDTGSKVRGNKKENFKAINDAESKDMFTCFSSPDPTKDQSSKELYAYGTYTLPDGTEINAVYQQELSPVLDGTCSDHSQTVQFIKKSINILTADLILLSDNTQAAGTIYESTKYENIKQGIQSWTTYEVLAARKRNQQSPSI